MIDEVMKFYNAGRRFPVQERYKFREIVENMALDRNHPDKRPTRRMCADLKITQKTLLNIKDLFVAYGAIYQPCRKPCTTRGERIREGISWGRHNCLPCGKKIF